MGAEMQSKVTLVTGAAGGIGSATARVLRREGAILVISDLEQTAGRALAEELSAETRFVAADVTDAAQVEAVVQETLRIHGRLDAAFNCAGIVGRLEHLADCEHDTWHRLLEINVTGMYHCLKAQLPAVGPGGSIVLAASAGALIGSSHMGAYGATKHAVLGLARSAAMEGAERGVRVNAVLPGAIDTAMPRALTEGDPEAWRALEEATPMKRFGRPEEVAEAVTWLCSDRASYVTGHGMVIDGGFTVQ